MRSPRMEHIFSFLFPFWRILFMKHSRSRRELFRKPGASRRGRRGDCVFHVWSRAEDRRGHAPNASRRRLPQGAGDCTRGLATPLAAATSWGLSRAALRTWSGAARLPAAPRGSAAGLVLPGGPSIAAPARWFRTPGVPLRHGLWAAVLSAWSAQAPRRDATAPILLLRLRTG